MDTSKIDRMTKIFNLINKKLRDTDINGLEMFAEFYMNGRELGYSITRLSMKPNGDEIELISKQFVFANNRNSDSIVVYFGEPRGFSMQGNVPSSDIYAKRRFFADQKDVVDFAIEFLAGD